MMTSKTLYSSRLNLTFKTLSAYLDICQSQSVSDTARKLGKTKSQISLMIKDVEEKLELDLVERNHKSIYVNEQGISVGRYIFLLANLCEFSTNQEKENITNIKCLNVKLPLRFFNGHVSQSFYKAIRQCRGVYPNIFIHPEFMDSYSEYSHGENIWIPHWETLNEIKIEYSSDNNSQEIYNCKWVILNNSHSSFPEKLDLAFLSKLVVTLPRMPWVMLTQITNFCSLHELPFKYSSEDYTKILSSLDDKDKYILLPEILITQSIREKLAVRDIDIDLSLGISLQSKEKHPIVDLFKSSLSNSLQEAATERIVWRPEATIKQWSYLLSILKEKSLNRASELMFISQPALSNQIKKLESKVGFPLFDRHMGIREIQKTFATNTYQSIAEGFESRFKKINDYSSEQKLNTEKKLRIGILPSIDHNSRLMDLIMNKVCTWGKDNPKVGLEIFEERHLSLIHYLRTQKIHLAITEIDSPWTNQFPLYAPEVIGLVVNNFNKEKIPESLHWEQLSDYPLVLPRKTTGIRFLIDSHCLQIGIDIVAEIESDSLNVNRQWLIEGRYSTILPKSAVESLIEDGIVSFIPLYPRLYRTLKITYLKNRVLTQFENSILDYITNKN